MLTEENEHLNLNAKDAVRIENARDAFISLHLLKIKKPIIFLKRWLLKKNKSGYATSHAKQN